MQKSESIAALAAALAKAQGEMGLATKDAVNPHLRNRYADLAALWEAARGPLSTNGLAVVQVPGNAPPAGHVSMVTTLLHASGEWMSGALTLPVQKADAQGYGSAITYARRYGLAAICGIAAGVDDDGEAAVRRSPPAVQQDHVSEALPQPRKPKKTAEPVPANGNGELPVHPVAQFEQDIADANTVTALAEIALRINDARLTKEDQAYLRPIYAARKKAIEPAPSSPAVEGAS